MIFLLYGIQEESVVREPLLRRPDMIYQPVRPREFWNQQPDMSRIEQVWLASCPRMTTMEAGQGDAVMKVCMGSKSNS
ncbi:hypothetical protein HPB48_018542 [Haemaphysalis longicornis]|uniref:Uncharacterized protein n=1 Tax=Haemaphysalis longicornis TaxID=44386 RepID=A0A9J6G8P8_HAELO|nr:hypothetical protein HPB48_018542 [Haemaphysalis longicornis]